MSAAGSTAADTLLVILTATVLGFAFCLRCEKSSHGKIRLASAAALVSLLFLAVTPSLPWFHITDACSHVDYLLGSERVAATGAGWSSDHLFELERWWIASAAVRLGLVMCVLMMLPALIWLLVDPLNRAAQSAVAVGASTAGFTALATVFYIKATPHWLFIEHTAASNLAVSAAAVIVIATVAIIRSAFADDRPKLPTAITR